MFFKIGILKNFAIFTGKHLCWRLFLIKLKTLAWQLHQKDTPTQVFTFEYSKIFQSTFFYRTPPVATSVLSKRCSGKPINFTGKHFCCSLFLIKLQVYKSQLYAKKRTQHKNFSLNFVNCFTAVILQNAFGWLFLYCF